MSSQLSVLDSKSTMEALRFGCIRLMEIASSILVRTSSTSQKLKMSHEVWALAQCAELISQRLPGLRSHKDAVSTSSAYLKFTDAICSLQHPKAEYEVLTQLAYPDLKEAVLAHLARIPLQADELTSECLSEVLERLDSVPTSSRGRPDCLGILADLLEDSGGVSRGELGEVGEYLSALPAIPIRPGREPGLKEGTPGESVTDGSRGSVLHDSIFRVEMCATEICAAILAHHPEAPWGLRYDLAKQVRDEARHYELFASRMKELEVKEGDYPLAFDVWDKFALGTTLPERLMIEQRLGEGTGLDGAVKTFRVLREEGDFKTLLIFDYIIADEITHVGNGNHWLRELTGSDENLAQLDRNVRSLLADVNMPVKHKHPINLEDRSLSGFTEEEIDELRTNWENERKLAQEQMNKAQLCKAHLIQIKFKTDKLVPLKQRGWLLVRPSIF